jgi:MFS family permease
LLANDCGGVQNGAGFGMAESPDRSPQLTTFTPTLVLLTLCGLINYVDRGNLSVAAPLLKAELNLSPWQLGILFAAFFTTYTGMQFVVGWLVDRFDVNRVLAAGFLLWSLATALTGFVRGFALLMVMRLILGTGESVAVPSCSKIIARYLPEHRRGFASGSVMSGLRLGNAVGTFGAGFLMAKFGWRPVFIVASSMEEMDAARRRSVDQCDGSGPGLHEHLQAAIVLGDIGRPVLLQLPAVFHADLAAHVSGA